MRPGLARRTGLLVTGMLATGAFRLAAQQPARPDSLADTSRVVELAPLIVTVTRTEEPLDRVPFAVDVAGARAVRGTRMTLGLDESLNDLPGVYVANRYNFSLDQRLSIRGFGSRSNFGVRGIKVLLDGVPQTLPDGQGQLTNVELGAVDRIEVLRGASSALYGNAAGGVVSLRSEPAAAAPYAQRLRVEGGDFGTFKWQSWSSARLGRLSGTLSLSRLTTDGFRQHSAADLRQLNAGADYLLSGTTTAGVRLALADDPKAQNPGALSPEQYAVSRRSAAASSIANDADKAVTQQQLAVFVRHQTSSGAEYQATVFGFHRDLDNPIATGTYITIGRHVAGLRLNGTQPLGSAGAPKVTAGLDLQWQRDDRANYVSAAGRRTDTLQLNQREIVAEVGPFVQVHWSPLAPLLVSAGARYDDVT
ncbi:MAG TPA: TonB-dependent receptor plug domain-containing protein, partial [Gemmatimonadales bacterium]|nr:TonB-dependent receptor plug domain-containing protein [Gemmatimonadales bacterium]